MKSINETIWKYLSPIDEAAVNTALKDDKEVMEFERQRNSGKVELSVLSNKLTHIVNSKQALFKKTLNDMITLVNKDLRKYGKTKLMYQIKSTKSIIDKALIRKKGLLALTDLVRGALLFETKDEADEYVKDFTRKHKNLVVDYEEKQRGQDTEYGYYGAHHLELNINGILVELQIMTRKLWAYKEAAHAIYTANRSNKDKGLSKEDSYDSKKTFSLGNKAKYVKESFSDEELGEMIYDDWKTFDL